MKLIDIIKELAEEKAKGLWHNIRAKRARGAAPAKKGSKAYKSAVKAAKEINKNK
jgi:hypothetical protein